MPNDPFHLRLMLGHSGRGGAAPIPDIPPTDTDIEAFKASVLAKLALAVGKDGDSATARDWFVATALALRDRVTHRWLAVNRASRAEGKKHV
jgi:starch phosphorylase